MVGVQSMRNIYCKQFPSNFCLFPSAIDAPGADFAASALSAPGHWLGAVWGAQEDVKRWISFSCFSCLGGFNQSSFCCRLSLVLLGSGKYLTTTLFQVYSVLWCGMLKVGFFTNSIILLSFRFSMRLAMPLVRNLNRERWNPWPELKRLTLVTFNDQASSWVRNCFKWSSQWALQYPPRKYLHFASQRWAHHPGGIVSGGVKHRCFNHARGWIKWLNGHGLRILDADSQVWSGFHMIVNVSQRVLLNFWDVGFCWEVMGPKPTGMYVTVQ